MYSFGRQFIFLLILLCASRVEAQRNIDVLHYQFQVNLNDDNDSLYGTASIRLKFLEKTNELGFDLTSLSKNKGMTVLSVSEKDASINYSHSQNKLRLELPGRRNPGDTATYTIRYKGIPADALIISKNKYGHRTFFADNWPDRGHNWLPCVDDPADKASVEFIVTAPQHYQVVANGVMTEETNLSASKKLTHWTENVPIATKVMVIGAADFAVNLSGVVDGCIPVTSWVYPEDRDKGFYDYALATDILKYFIGYIGPYGYKKLANVQSKTIFGGLENANTIFYAENSITGDRKKEDLLAHEIAHQWFGNMATEKSFAHLWLSEGFATYMTIIYMESKYGKDTAISMLKEDRGQVIQFARGNNKTVVDETQDYMELLNANSYQKGSWILHMLRKELGDSIFHKGIRSYYASYAGRNADSKDLQVAFEKVSGKDLAVFFKQWLYMPGLPLLDIKWGNMAEGSVLVRVKQLQKNGFQFPLELALQTVTGKVYIEKLNIHNADQSFTLKVKEKIVNVVIDPHTALLFSGSASAGK